MMMMIMTLMKLVNSVTKVRHGMDKFYQPDSGLGSSRSLHEAIYTYTHLSNHCMVKAEQRSKPFEVHLAMRAVRKLADSNPVLVTAGT